MSIAANRFVMISQGRGILFCFGGCSIETQWSAQDVKTTHRQFGGLILGTLVSGMSVV